MTEEGLYKMICSQLEVTNEAHARDVIRIVRAVLMEHDRESRHDAVIRRHNYAY